MFPSDYSKLIGSLIRKYRLDICITAKELTSRAGLSKNYVQKVERGEKEIRILQLKKLADEMRVEIRDLLP